jgi:mono/diheme cytochrome c family protein
MKLRGVFLCVFASVVFTAIGVFAADTNTIVTTPPVYVPDMSHASGPLPDGILVWDGTTKETNVTAETTEAHFIFSFTNIATVHETALVTNVTTITSITAVTNSFFFWFKKISFVTNFSTATGITTNNVTKPVPVVILDVHTSCGCTTAKLPPRPWTIPAGTNTQFDVTINLAGRSGMLLKTVDISTDKGTKRLILKVTILPPVTPVMSEADRLRALAVAKTNRQAVFQGECAVCHVRRGVGKYGQALYDADCAICHKIKNRATVVPDLHAIKTPTNDEFWRTWIAHGKPGSLMPAFSAADGGPLSDVQIASLVAYLNQAISSQVPSSQ